MHTFVFEECSQFADKLKEICGNYHSPNFIHSVRFDPQSGSVDLHVCKELFRNLVPADVLIETSVCADAILLNAKTSGVRLTVCLLKGVMASCTEDLERSTEEIYKEWAERTGWPYVYEN